MHEGGAGVKIDAHVHLWDQVSGYWDGRSTSNQQMRFGKYRVGEGKAATEYQMMPHTFEDSRSTVERLMMFMDAHQIDRAVVLQEWLDGNQDHYVAAARRSFPGRLSVLSLLPPDVCARVDDYVATLKTLRLQGVLYSHRLQQMNPAFRLDDAAFHPIWQHCQDEGLPLTLKLPPGDTQLEEVRYLIHRYPNLSLVISHLGLPHHRGWMEQIKLARNAQVYVDLGGLTAFYKHEGFPFPTARAAIKFAVQEIGAHKMMWGSDYPRTIVDFSYKQNIEWLGWGGYFTQEEQRWMFGQTARQVYCFNE